MPVQIPPGFIQVTYFFHQGGANRPASNTMGYGVTGGLTTANVNTISSTIAPYYKACLNTSGTFDGVKVIIGNDGPMTEILSTSGNGAGTKTTAMLPAQNQAVLAKTTGLRGRKFRGRCFVGDVREANVGDDGSMNSTELTVYNDLASHLNSALGLGALISASYILHSDTTVPTVITGMGCDTKVGTLRRRYKR